MSNGFIQNLNGLVKIAFPNLFIGGQGIEISGKVRDVIKNRDFGDFSSFFTDFFAKEQIVIRDAVSCMGHEAKQIAVVHRIQAEGEDVIKVNHAPDRNGRNGKDLNPSVRPIGFHPVGSERIQNHHHNDFGDEEDDWEKGIGP